MFNTGQRELRISYFPPVLPRFIYIRFLLTPPTSLDAEQKPPPALSPLPVSRFSILLVTAAAKQSRRVREMMCQWKVL